MTRWLRIIVGIVAGYPAVVILSSGTTAILRSLLEVARAEDPPAAYLVFDLFYSLVYATAAGWVAVRIGASAWSAYVLAALFLVLGAWTVLAGLDQTHPLAYQWAAAVLTPLAVLAGGRLAGRNRTAAGRNSSRTGTSRA